MRSILCAFTIMIFGSNCFAFAQPATKVPVNIITQEVSAPVPQITQAQNTKTTDGVYLGVFREGAPRNMGFIKSFEKTIGKKAASVVWYLDWSSDFPVNECISVNEYGAVPHIVWEPWFWGEEDKIKLDNILSGEWDKYIEKWATGAKNYDKPVLLRWGHEFNIEKYPWGVGNNGKDPEKYIKAYKHVHDIFTKVGATNVKWIWCFNNYANPDEDWNQWQLAYPGDAYVDWIGIDGYNWGKTQSWSGWQSFKEMFRDQIREANKLYPTKPVMIAEFGSTEDGGDKAAWVKAIPEALTISMKSVKAIVLFDVKKECDWRSTSCKRTEDAYKNILKDNLFLGDGTSFDKFSYAGVKFEKKTVVAKKASSPIIINGDFAPFSDSTPIVMDNSSFLKEGGPWKGTKDLSASIYLLWDESYLYIFAKVTDSFPLSNSKTNGDIWNGDAIEITVPSYQIGLGAGDGRGNAPSIWVWQKRKPSSGGEIIAVRTSNPTGYDLQAKLPWREIGFIVPKVGNTLPFDIAVDDADETWSRKNQFVWNGDYLFYKDPDVWGSIKFEN